LRLVRHWPTALILLITLLLTVFHDLISGIAAGTALYYLTRFASPIVLENVRH
jgi:MFS superfamily sulfate permease-like transporter